jgi:hypothetical protein
MFGEHGVGWNQVTSIIRSNLFNDNVIGETHLHVLQNGFSGQCSITLMDGAPPHFTFSARAFPNKKFTINGFYKMATKVTTPTIFNFILSGHLKSVAYKERPRNFQKLKEHIMSACIKIKKETLVRV